VGGRGGDAAAGAAAQPGGAAGPCPRTARPARAVAQTRPRPDAVATPLSAVGELANQTAAHEQLQVVIEAIDWAPELSGELGRRRLAAQRIERVDDLLARRPGEHP